MEFKEEHELRTAHLSFIGKILSVFTHELNNHLAIIKESAGLIDDILTVNKSSARQELEGCSKALQLIAEQIGKASYLARNLNHFGHRMDQPVSSFNINEALDELLVLLSRAAGQKMITFEKDFGGNIPAIQSDPAGLQFLIFCLIEKGFKKLDKNGGIILKTSHSKELLSISIIMKGDLIDTDDVEVCKDETFKYLLNQLRGNMVWSAENQEVIITLPLSMHSAGKM